MEGGGSSSTGGSHSREYCLRWNNHQPNMVSFLSNLLPKESFADVTLVSAEGTKIQAHRIILSACSPYFEGVFEGNPCKHPVVILKDVQYVDLRAIVSFIYNGEVNIEVDRINEIIQTATALQVKGLAEVPADEFKRVSLGGRCSSPAERNSPAPTSRTQPPPLMSSGRTWQSNVEAGDNHNDLPARKKLKKSASANIPFSSGSSSTNGDVANSNGSSFESGIGTSRSVDEGIGSDAPSIDQSSVRPGPPPLTAANAIIPKSRSLDDGYQRKNANNADGSSESGGYADQSGMDDNGLQEGYDEMEGANGYVKMEGVHHALGLSYVEDGGEEDEQGEVYYEEDSEIIDDYEGSLEAYNQSTNSTTEHFERPHVPLRNLLPKGKNNRLNKNNNNNNNNATNQVAGVGHSLSIYRHQPAMKNFTPRALIGKRRRGRPLLRQHRINKSSPGGGRDDGGGYEEQGYSSDTGEASFNTKTSSSPSCFEPQQQHYHHQARSASVEHEMYNISTSAIIPTTIQQHNSRSPSRSHSPQMKPTVPIVRVSQCSPTPPGSPQHISSPKIEEGNSNGGVEQINISHSIQQHHPIIHRQHSSSLSGSSSSLVSGMPPGSSSTSSAALLTVPVVGESGSPSVTTLRLAGPPQHHHQQGYLIKQVSQPLLPSHSYHYHSSEDEAGPSPTPSSNPVIRRQHSQPVQSSTRAYPSYSIVGGRGQLFHILKSEQYTRDEETVGAGAYYVESPMLQLVPASGINSSNSSSGGGGMTVKEVSSSSPSATTSPTQSQMESVSITLREVGHSKSLTSDGMITSAGIITSERSQLSPSAQSSAGGSAIVSTITKDSSSSKSLSTDTFASLRAGLSEGQLIHRSGHCPALRPGPALGCNFCWNSVDSCGRVLRRKTKYFCPECHINLCIVPCFQEYHEKSDRKKKSRTKLGLPKPSSM